MNDLSQLGQDNVNNLNPVVREGIMREFARMDIQSLDFDEKAKDKIKQLLEIQFKAIVKAWNREDGKVEDRQKRINRTEVFNSIVKEILTEFETAITENNKNDDSVQSKISSVKRYFDPESIYTIVKDLVKAMDKNIYSDYLEYRIDCKKEKIDMEKKNIDVSTEKIDIIRERIAENQEQLLKLEKELNLYKKAQSTDNEKNISEYIENLNQLCTELMRNIEGLKDLESEYIKMIELMKRLYELHLKEKEKEEREHNEIIEELTPNEPNALSFKTEEEYVEELKDIELEMIKTERGIKTKRRFVFGDRRNNENEEKEDITYKMMQIYSELSQMIDGIETNDIPKIYNRIIRKLKKMPDIDDSKLPPMLKEKIVKRVETPLFARDNMIEHSGDEQPKDENIDRN